MTQKIIAIAAVLAAAILSGIFATTQLAFADESETSTEQEIKQKNVGSGDSTNVNCGDNDIAGVEEVPTEEDCTRPTALWNVSTSCLGTD